MRKNVFRRATAALLGAAVISMAAPAVTATATTPPATDGTDLPSGQKLMPGQSVINGESELVMQADGNLVIYLDGDNGHRGPVLWASGTYNNPGAYAYMQPDGNFVIYRQGGSPESGGALWSTGSWGHPGAHAFLWNGQLVVSDWGALWQSPSGYTPGPGDPNTTLDWKHLDIRPGAWIESNSVWLIMQTDGNLVLYRKRDGAALWSTGTYGHPGVSAHISEAAYDSALYLFSADAGVIWSLPYHGQTGNHAKVQDDGNFVLYSFDGTVRWSTGTWGNW
ncbi:hypothetical protein ACIHEI_23055 [Kitasatospora sp. NPDC051984]|uniref:hypothetical protein n=1 Tax=Kitasatospora sp. NPDC051984 TaxID=3364059 RepID=UPI0037C7FEAC